MLYFAIIQIATDALYKKISIHNWRKMYSIFQLNPTNQNPKTERKNHG